MDADGQHEVQEIPNLIVGGLSADVVIGAHPERASRLRHIAWRWFRAIAGFELRDLTSGFRYYNRQAIEILAASEATLLDYQDVGVLLLLRKVGLHILEVPVSMNERAVGRSRIFYSWFSVIRYMITTTLLCLARWNQNPKRPHTSPSSRPSVWAIWFCSGVNRFGQSSSAPSTRKPSAMRVAPTTASVMVPVICRVQPRSLAVSSVGVLVAAMSS